MKKHRLRHSFIATSIALTSLAHSAGLAQNVFPSEGNVGIGSASPPAKLSVQAPDGPILSLIQSSPFGHQENNLQVESRISPNFAGADFAFRPNMWTGSGYSRQVGFLLSAEGRVGIGTFSPPQQLSLTGGIGFANHNATDKKLYSPTDGVLEWMTHDWAPTKGFAISHQGDQRIFLASSGDSFLNGGRVGIGTPTPQGTLDVNGDTYSKSIHLTAGPESGSYILSKERLHLQCADGNAILLNPSGGIVSVNALVPGALHVNGKIVTGVVELTSDRNKKTDFAPVDPLATLEKLCAVSIRSWVLTNSPSVRHVGAMAQDFHEQFAYGASELHIGAGDAIGVVMSAVQGLRQIVRDQHQEIENLRRTITEMQGDSIAVKR